MLDQTGAAPPDPDRARLRVLHHWPRGDRQRRYTLEIIVGDVVVATLPQVTGYRLDQTGAAEGGPGKLSVDFLAVDVDVDFASRLRPGGR